MIILLMGVAGSGKTTVGELLAGQLEWPFHDADDFHPQENVEKMAKGIPLTDQDRLPWLERLNGLLRNASQLNSNIVLACSALKNSYREVICADVPDLRIVYLKGDYRLIERRMLERKNHYMKHGMLRSQLDALEEPTGVLTIDITEDIPTIVKEIRSSLDV